MRPEAAEPWLACDWPDFDVDADFGRKKEGVLACAHAMPLNLSINDIIGRTETTQDMLKVLDTLALFQRHDNLNNCK